MKKKRRRRRRRRRREEEEKEMVCMYLLYISNGRWYPMQHTVLLCSVLV